jgi:hypothetical protein
MIHKEGILCSMRGRRIGSALLLLYLNPFLTRIMQFVPLEHKKHGVKKEEILFYPDLFNWVNPIFYRFFFLHMKRDLDQ